MRTNLFFALELSDDARAAVHSFAGRWRAQVGEGRRDIWWYAPEDYHVTLKFLGAREACEEEAFVVAGNLAVEQLRQELSRPVEGVAIRPAGAGAFPSPARSRVLWAGVEAAAGLSELALRVDEACAQFGVAREGRAFKPHVTLARCGGNRPVDLPSVAPAIFPEFVQNRFVLMRTSSPQERKIGQKLRYNTVHTFAL